MNKEIIWFTFIILIRSGQYRKKNMLDLNEESIINRILEMRSSEECTKYIAYFRSINDSLSVSEIVKTVFNDIYVIVRNVFQLKYDTTLIKAILSAHVLDYTKIQYYSLKSILTAEIVFDLFCIHLKLDEILSEYQNRKIYELFNTNSLFKDDFFYQNFSLINQDVITSDNDIYMALVSRIIFYILSYNYKFTRSERKRLNKKDIRKEISYLSTNFFTNIYLPNITIGSRYYLLSVYGFKHNRVSGRDPLDLYVNFCQSEDIIVYDDDNNINDILFGEIDIAFLENTIFVFSDILEFEFIMGLLQYFSGLFLRDIIVKVTAILTEDHMDYVIKIISTQGVNLEKINDFFKDNFDNSSNLYLKDNILQVISEIDNNTILVTYKILEETQINIHQPLEVYQLSCGCFVDISLLVRYIHLHNIYCSKNDSCIKIVYYYKINSYELINY